MLATDRTALECDMAETYGVFDFEGLPARKLAALAVGLRENSRIKMKMAGEKATQQDVMQAAIVDRLSLLLWAQTKDGQNGTNRPKSIVDLLLNAQQEPVGFDTPEEFEAEWARITGVNHG